MTFEFEVEKYQLVNKYSNYLVTNSGKYETNKYTWCAKLYL